MRPAHRLPPAAGALTRRFASYTGLFFDDFAPDSVWIREAGHVQLPPLRETKALILRGSFRPHPLARGIEQAAPHLDVVIHGQTVATVAPNEPGTWEVRFDLPDPAKPTTIGFQLRGVRLTNTLAWLGRLTGLGLWQRFRNQHKNRQLRLASIATGAGEIIFDFSRRDAPYSPEFARRHTRLGINVVGFLTADLGVGESARCMVRAADAAQLPIAVVPLKLNCKNQLGDSTYLARLQAENPHPVNIIHVDPPASRDLDHHHGPAFRADKYNIAYFAWELPEFPDAWASAFDFYDEIWCPSDFTTKAIALKSPVPVLTMPHSIAFAAPTESRAALRARLGLPAEPFLFLTLFDLNSYAERKNPRAVIEAYRRSELGQHGAGLVIKVQNVAGNENEFGALQQNIRDLPGTILLSSTLSRADVYGLEAACDAFVSLHRSEGFGLAVAECMYLGKPVLSTDWSATAEFVDATNGCPIRCDLVTLERSHGPYAKGSTWAQPDPGHAAEWMRRLFLDRDLAARLGKAAAASMRTRFSPAVIGARYRRRLEAIAAF